MFIDMLIHMLFTMFLHKNGTTYEKKASILLCTASIDGFSIVGYCPIYNNLVRISEIFFQNFMNPASSGSEMVITPRWLHNLRILQLTWLIGSGTGFRQQKEPQGNFERHLPLLTVSGIWAAVQFPGVFLVCDSWFYPLSPAGNFKDRRQETSHQRVRKIPIGIVENWNWSF